MIGLDDWAKIREMIRDEIRQAVFDATEDARLEQFTKAVFECSRISSHWMPDTGRKAVAVMIPETVVKCCGPHELIDRVERAFREELCKAVFLATKDGKP